MTRRQFFQQYFTFRNKLHEDLLKGYNRMIPGLFLGGKLFNKRDLVAFLAVETVKEREKAKCI